MVEQDAPGRSKQSIAKDPDTADGSDEVVILEEVLISLKCYPFVVECCEHTERSNAGDLEY